MGERVSREMRGGGGESSGEGGEEGGRDIQGYGVRAVGGWRRWGGEGEGEERREKMWSLGVQSSPQKGWVRPQEVGESVWCKVQIGLGFWGC